MNNNPSGGIVLSSLFIVCRYKAFVIGFICQVYFNVIVSALECSVVFVNFAMQLRYSYQPVAVMAKKKAIVWIIETLFCIANELTIIIEFNFSRFVIHQEF